MKTLKYITVTFLIIYLAFVIVAINNNVKPHNLGGASDGSYIFKNISSSNASATVPVQVIGGPGLLGNITVNTTSAQAIGIYDGTATSTGTLIGTLKASVSEQTFNYEVSVRKGIVLDVPAAYTGSITVSYK